MSRGRGVGVCSRRYCWALVWAWVRMSLLPALVHVTSDSLSKRVGV